MAMTITEASAVNRVLDYCFGAKDRYPFSETTAAEFVEHIAVLARSANKALGAGWTETQARELAEVNAPRLSHARARRSAKRAQA